jgi:hypothetical protein
MRLCGVRLCVSVQPALCTKSGAVFRGDDYLEIGMNLFRFGARPTNPFPHRATWLDYLAWHDLT